MKPNTEEDFLIHFSMILINFYTLANRRNENNLYPLPITVHKSITKENLETPLSRISSVTGVY